MRIRKCKDCGTLFAIEKSQAYLCPDCALAHKRASVIRPRTCRACGVTFDGGPRAWYCPDCRTARNRAANTAHSRKGTARPLGSMDICQKCGAQYVVKGSRQKYCKACAAGAIAETVREHKRPIQRALCKDPIRAARRKPTRICIVCGNPITTSTTAVTCSPACAADRQCTTKDIAVLVRNR